MSNLAITRPRGEKRRPAGCVGNIFFHLGLLLASSSSNNKSTKKRKKLFISSNNNKDKLLIFPQLPSSVRPITKSAVQHPIAIVGNKLRLIALDNCGVQKPGASDGLTSSTDDDPAAASGEINIMRDPGLVARLMGLDSMPAVPHRPTKAPAAAVNDAFDAQQHSDLHLMYLQQTDRQLLKTDSRPHSTQTRFSPEILSRTKRLHHHKLPSPVKSSRLHSRPSATRLMQAATKILEPGLQPRGRAKCDLTYRAPLPLAYADGSHATLSSKIEKQPPLNHHIVGPCRSCGSILQVSDPRPGAPDISVANHAPSASEDSNNSSSSLHGSLGTKLEAPAPLNNSTLAVQVTLNVQSRSAHNLQGRQLHTPNYPDQCKPWNDGTPESATGKSSSRRSHPPLFRGNALHMSKVSNRTQTGRNRKESNEPKDLVHFNRNLRDSQCTRSATKASVNSQTETERNGNLTDPPCTRLPSKASIKSRMETKKNGLEKSTSRKRRLTGGPQIESVSAISSTFTMQGSAAGVLTSRKGAGFSGSRPIIHSCAGSDLRKRVDCHSSSGGSDEDIGSFLFSSPMRNGSRSFPNQQKKEKCRGLVQVMNAPSYSGNLVSDAKNESLLPRKGTALQGDELSNLLEQKIKELTSSDREEFTTGNALPMKSTASILQELISSLTVEAPVPKSNDDSYSNASTLTDSILHGFYALSNGTLPQNQSLPIKSNYQEESKPGISTGFLVTDSGQPSPISILEASLSNDSYSFGSSTQSSVSGSKPHIRSTESRDKSQKLDPDTDILDSATFTDTSASCVEKILQSIDKRFSMCIYNLCELRIYGTRFGHADEAILNAELFFKNISFNSSDGTFGSSLYSFLPSMLETIVDAFWISPEYCLGFTMKSQVKGFLFDCIIECLNTRYDHFFKSGFKACSRLPMSFSREQLTHDIQEELRGWRDLAGQYLDDVIKKEFSASVRKWLKYESERCETGIEIISDILQGLVNELVKDLCSYQA